MDTHKRYFLVSLCSAAFLSAGLTRAIADERLVAEISEYLEKQTPAEIIKLDPQMFRKLSELDCSGFVDHASLIVETLSTGKVRVTDLRTIDKEIGRPTFLHDFIERTIVNEDLTTLAGAKIVTEVADDCEEAIDRVIEKHIE